MSFPKIKRKSDLALIEALKTSLYWTITPFFLFFSLGIGMSIGCLGSIISGSQIWFFTGLIIGQIIMAGMLTITGLFDWANQFSFSLS